MNAPNTCAQALHVEGVCTDVDVVIAHRLGYKEEDGRGRRRRELRARACRHRRERPRRKAGMLAIRILAQSADAVDAAFATMKDLVQSIKTEHG